MIRTSLLAALAAVLLVPASAAADTVTFGSDLAGRPDVMDDSHLADTLFYNTTAKNSNRAPASGEILQILVKGAIIPHGNGRKDYNLWHSQVLRPQTDGSVTVDSSSQDLYFPVGEPVDQIHRFVPSVQCVRAGDYIDFNHIGGWDGGPDGTGTKYQIFKSDQNSQMNWYEHDNGTNIGANFVPNRQVFGNTGRENTANPQHGAPYPRELMMQVTIGTGFDSSSLCEGGAKGAEYSGAAITRKLFSVADDGVAGARIGCTTGRGFCEGTAKLVLRRHGDRRARRSRSTATRPRTSPIQLTPAGARLVSERGQIDADVIVDSHDELGQQRTTSGVSELKSLRRPGLLRPHGQAAERERQEGRLLLQGDLPDVDRAGAAPARSRSPRRSASCCAAGRAARSTRSARASS